MTTTITATAEPDAVPPRVNLSITSTLSSLTVYRVGVDGTQVAVRTADDAPLPVSGSATLIDPEAPFGVPVTYTSSDAATTPSAEVTLDVADVWLVNPAVPARSVRVRLSEVSDRQSAANMSVRYPLGRRFPIVAHDGQRKADTYTLVVRTDGQAELDALKAVLSDLSPLLLNVPLNAGWVDLPTEYIAVGDLSRANPGGFLAFQQRFWSLPCSVVDRPTGGAQSFNTYAYSLSLYPTYADRKAAHATYGEAFNVA